MKNRLLLLAAVMLATLSTRAVDVIEPNTDYYILNVETDMFLGGQNYWGTQGAVSTDAGIFQFVPGSDALSPGYNLKNTLVAVANKYLGTNLYTDNAGTMPVKADEAEGTVKTVDGIWQIVDQGSGIFAFYCPSQWAYTDGNWVETKHGYLAKSEVAGYRKGYELTFSEELTEACMFRVMTYQEALDYMVNKAQSNNVSYNFLIKNPDFCRNQSTDDWVVSSNCTNYTLGTTRGNTGNNTFNNNTCAESYRSPFAIYQVVKNLPAGRYQLSAQGFYRHDAGSDTDYPCVYVGPSASPIAKSILPKHDGSENNMYTSGESFANGKYKADNVRFELKEKTDLEIGFYAANGNYWVIFDNIQLMSYSNVPEYAQEILAEIKYPIEGVGSADAKAAYDQAYVDFKTWVEGLQQGDATFDEVDQRYADYLLAENAWKASIAAWSDYVTVSEKAKKLYTQIASQEGKYKPSKSMNALNSYVNGAASAYGPGSESNGYVFANGCYNYIMQALSMDDEAIAGEVEFVNGLMNDVKKSVVQPGMDVSFLLTNADFKDTNVGYGWTRKNSGSVNWNIRSGLSGWPVSEAYIPANNSTFEIYQEVESVPAGLYKVKVNAFHRPAGSWTAETNVPVVLYMGSIENKIQNIAADPIENDLVWNEEESKWLDGTVAKNGTNCYFWDGNSAKTDADKELWKNNKNEDPEIQNMIANSTSLTSAGKYNSDQVYNETYLIPNGMDGSSIAFSAGRYPMVVYGEVPDEGDGFGKLRIGLKSAEALMNGAWTLWGGFTLELLGEDREAMRAQLIDKVAALEASPLRIAGTGLQEVFLNDTVETKIPEFKALIDDNMATYQDYKTAYDVAVYMLAKLDVYQAAIDKFNTTQAELAELIAGYDADPTVKKYAQNVYEAYDLMSTLESGSMINLTNEDMENLKVYEVEVMEYDAPETLTKEMLEDEEFNPSAAADGAYTSTYDFYNSLLAELRVQLGSIFIQVAGTGTPENPEDLTEQLRNPAFESDEQWWGDTWGDIQNTAGEMYQKVFDSYQSVHLPKGFYTLVGYAMDRRGAWADVLSNNAQWRYNDASFLYAKVGEADTASVEVANAKWVAQTEDLTEGTGGIATYEVGDPVVTYYAPNSMAQYRNWMDAKGDFNFGTELSFEVTEENGVFASLGFFRRAYESASWFIADGIKLYYAADGNPVTGVNTLEASAEKFGQAEGKRLEGNRIVIYSNGKKFNTAGQILK